MMSLLHFVTCMIFISQAFGDDYPAAFTSNNRILIQLLSYDLHHFESLEVNLNEYLSICEGGWNPQIIIHTCAKYTDKLLEYILERLYCYRISNTVPLTILQYDSDGKEWLSNPSRNIVRHDIDNYDLFIYQEDNILFRFSTLTAYVHETKLLQSKVSSQDADKYYIGLLPYHNKRHEKEAFVNGDNAVQEFIINMPSVDYVCLGDMPYVKLSSSSNELSQGMWILAKKQLLVLQQKCSFFDTVKDDRDYMSSTQLFQQECGLVKVLPAPRLRSLLVHRFNNHHHDGTNAINSPHHSSTKLSVINFELFAKLGLQGNDANIYHSADVLLSTTSSLPTCWNEVVSDMKNDISSRSNMVKFQELLYDRLYKNFSNVAN